MALLLSAEMEEAGGQEVAEHVAAVAAGMSSYSWVVVPSSVHQKAQTVAHHQHTDVRTQHQLDVVVGVADDVDA